MDQYTKAVNTAELDKMLNSFKVSLRKIYARSSLGMLEENLEFARNAFRTSQSEKDAVRCEILLDMINQKKEAAK